MQPERRGGAIRVFFYVQHLLGIGHLHRAARVVKALDQDGFAVQLALGGPASPDLDVGAAEIVRLPPVKAGPDGFSKLVHPDGRPFDKADQTHRAGLLLEAFDRFRPDILITEAFPFGRRQMRFELLPLLERARSRLQPPLIAASVRDILQRDHRPERAAETVALVERFYDIVLVHGDPALTRLEASFPEARRFGNKLTYTGLVAPEPTPERRTEVAKLYGAVVSVGGGAVGGPLLEAALSARPLTRIADRPWLLLTGPNLTDAARDLLLTRTGDEVRVERFVPNLVQVLGRADVSVSQAGYNTVCDILVGGCRAVLIPYGRDGETEQGDRAALLESRAMAVTVTEEQLTPERLAAAIDQSLEIAQVSRSLDLGGARATARLLRDFMTVRKAGLVRG